MAQIDPRIQELRDQLGAGELSQEEFEGKCREILAAERFVLPRKLPPAPKPQPLKNGECLAWAVKSKSEQQAEKNTRDTSRARVLTAAEIAERAAEAKRKAREASKAAKNGAAKGTTAASKPAPKKPPVYQEGAKTDLSVRAIRADERAEKLDSLAARFKRGDLSLPDYQAAVRRVQKQEVVFLPKPGEETMVDVADRRYVVMGDAEGRHKGAVGATLINRSGEPIIFLYENGTMAVQQSVQQLTENGDAVEVKLDRGVILTVYFADGGVTRRWYADADKAMAAGNRAGQGTEKTEAREVERFSLSDKLTRVEILEAQRMPTRDKHDTRPKAAWRYNHSPKTSSISKSGHWYGKASNDRSHFSHG